MPSPPCAAAPRLLYPRTADIRRTEPVAMAAINMSLVARSEAAVAEIAKRSNFASREPGVIVVFAIVGAVAILMLALFISKKV